MYGRRDLAEQIGAKINAALSSPHYGWLSYPTPHGLPHFVAIYMVALGIE